MAAILLSNREGRCHDAAAVHVVMRIRLSPTMFFAGLIGGLVCLSWLGASVKVDSLTNHFVRFHRSINIEAGFFPTANEVVDIVDRTGDESRRIYVIVGGSSVFHGVGQHASLIWTSFLQRELGDRFRVINFAQRAGSATDFGNIAAEYLIRNSKRVIYVGNGNSFAGSLAASPEMSAFKHIIFDAWQRNLLLPWPPRDRMLSRAIFDASEQTRGVAIGALLNRYLNFNELWNYISFELVNLNWNSLLATQSFYARRLFADPELLPQQYETLRYRDDIDVAMRFQRAQIVPSNDAWWADAQREIDLLIPPELRKVTLCVLNLDSPYYRRRLSKNEQQDLLATLQTSADLLAALGFNWIVSPNVDFADEDYLDRVHMSASGGQKLAIAIAPTIRKMAMDFGYFK